MIFIVDGKFIDKFRFKNIQNQIGNKKKTRTAYKLNVPRIEDKQETRNPKKEYVKQAVWCLKFIRGRRTWR